MQEHIDEVAVVQAPIDAWWARPHPTCLFRAERARLRALTHAHTLSHNRPATTLPRASWISVSPLPSSPISSHYTLFHSHTIIHPPSPPSSTSPLSSHPSLAPTVSILHFLTPHSSSSSATTTTTTTTTSSPATMSLISLLSTCSPRLHHHPLHRAPPTFHPTTLPIRRAHSHHTHHQSHHHHHHHYHHHDSHNDEVRVGGSVTIDHRNYHDSHLHPQLHELVQPCSPQRSNSLKRRRCQRFNLHTTTPSSSLTPPHSSSSSSNRSRPSSAQCVRSSSTSPSSSTTTAVACATRARSRKTVAFAVKQDDSDRDSDSHTSDDSDCDSDGNTDDDSDAHGSPRRKCSASSSSSSPASSSSLSFSLRHKSRRRLHAASPSLILAHSILTPAHLHTAPLLSVSSPHFSSSSTTSSSSSSSSPSSSSTSSLSASLSSRSRSSSRSSSSSSSCSQAKMSVDVRVPRRPPSSSSSIRRRRAARVEATAQTSCRFQRQLHRFVRHQRTAFQRIRRLSDLQLLTKTQLPQQELQQQQQNGEEEEEVDMDVLQKQHNDAEGEKEKNVVEQETAIAARLLTLCDQLTFLQHTPLNRHDDDDEECSTSNVHRVSDDGFEWKAVSKEKEKWKEEKEKEAGEYMSKLRREVMRLSRPDLVEQAKQLRHLRLRNGKLTRLHVRRLNSTRDLL